MVLLLPSNHDTKIRMGKGLMLCDPPTTIAMTPSTSTSLNETPLALLESLPLELIHEIFALCLPEDFRAPLATSEATAPLQLCHVSQAWRRAAISEPRLWRNLKLQTRNMQMAVDLESYAALITKLTAQAQFWLDNGGEAGIRLVLEVVRPGFEIGPVVHPPGSPFSKPEEQLITTQDALQAWDQFTAGILVERASRIRSLEMVPLTAGSSSWVSHFLYPQLPQAQDFSRLESVFIVGSQLPVMVCPGCHTQGLFATSPTLKKVAIVFATISSMPANSLPETFLPWKQLTHLKIKMPCSGAFWKRILVQSEQLVSCVMHLEHCIVDGDRDPPLSDSGISLPYLEHLDITFHDEFNSLYFHDFHFPALKRLIIACDIGNGFPTFTWLPASHTHLSAQLRHLKSLTLSYQNITSEDLTLLLREMDALEELVVDSYLGDHQHFLKSLTLYPDQTTKPIVPNLKSLILFLEYHADTPPTTFEEVDLLTMMASRAPLATEIARHNCIRHSVELEGIYTTKDPDSRKFLPNGLVSTSLVNVELWADNEEGTKFDLLDKFQEVAESTSKQVREDSSVPDWVFSYPFTFSFEFNCASEWLVQRNEPIWYD